MAYLFALGNRELVHGVAAIGAPLPAGAQVPSQAVASKPGSNSAMAGTSGMTSARVAPVTAKARNLPVRTNPIAAGTVMMKAWICPASRSVNAPAGPR